MKKVFFASLLSMFFLMSCSNDDTFDPIDDPNLVFDNGFFVLNEGAFGGAPGTATFVSNNLETVEHEIYMAANPTKELGLGTVLQSMFFHGENAYIISNGSNVITVVNRYTFEFVGEITGGLNAPRYGAAVNGKAYVTNQAGWQTSEDDFIAVINLETLEVEETVLANAPVEYILEENDKLYIQNAGYGIGNEISVLDPATNSITASITVGEGLNSIEIEDNTLYALSSSKIEKVDLSSLGVTTLASFPTDFGSVSNLEVENGEIYFTSGDKIYSMAIGASQIPANPIIDYNSNSEFGAMYGFEVEENRIFIAEGGDFASSSYVKIYSISGDLEKEINVGVAPNGFYFNN
ncbi:MAG TPA: DUF5074 domain-containing protein [Flavobacteriaceae bacterium]|nr:DUF5074 domain-containing protein [Flavobacteriaceae bacterium]